MNSQERDALREKHKAEATTFGPPDELYCTHCGDWRENIYDYRWTPYPCDTIKVLDAWEAERTPDSEHPELKIPSPVQSSTGSEPAEKPTECDLNHKWWQDLGLPLRYCTYCPKCGEKL